MQQEHGDFLTYKESLEKLSKEEKNKNKRRSRHRYKKQGKSRKQHIYACNEEEPPGNNKNSEDEDEVVKKVLYSKCKRWYPLSCVKDP